MSPRKSHTGLSRLTRYTGGRRLRLTVLAVAACLTAAAPVVGWHLVRDAVDRGMQPGNEGRLALDVLGYIANPTAMTEVLGSVAANGNFYVGTVPSQGQARFNSIYSGSLCDVSTPSWIEY